MEGLSPARQSTGAEAAWKAASFDAAPTGGEAGSGEGTSKDQALLTVAQLTSQPACHANQALKRASIFTGVLSTLVCAKHGIPTSRSSETGGLVTVSDAVTG